MWSVIFTCQQHWWMNHCSCNAGTSAPCHKGPAPTVFSRTSHPLTSTLIVSIIYWLDIVSLCQREVMIGRSSLHVLLTVSLPETVWKAGPWQRKAWGDASPDFVKLGCIEETEASAGLCACSLNGYMMWLWLYWCSASAYCWQRRCELDAEPIPAV